MQPTLPTLASMAVAKVLLLIGPRMVQVGRSTSHDHGIDPVRPSPLSIVHDGVCHKPSA